MISEQDQEQASLYVLAALTREEAQAFEAKLAENAELRDLTRSLQSTLVLVARVTPVPALRPGFNEMLKEQVLRQIRQLKASSSPSGTSPGLSFMAGADQRGWKSLPIPGASIKLLSLEKERGYAVLLGRLEPGVRYPAHINAGPEDLYILSGDLVVGDRKLAAGDFHHAAAGSRHEENYSEEGCTLLAVLTTDDPLVVFAAA